MRDCELLTEKLDGREMYLIELFIFAPATEIMFKNTVELLHECILCGRDAHASLCKASYDILQQFTKKCIAVQGSHGYLTCYKTNQENHSET